MPHPRVILSALAVIAALAGGCVSGHSGPTTDARRFRPGHTRFQDVVAAWGNPDSIKGWVGVWREGVSRGGRLKAAYMMVGVTVANSHVTSREYRLKFRPDGVLESVSVQDAVPNGARWSLWPW